VAKELVDVAGLGLNATDTVLIVREFPALGGKARVLATSQQAGGQVATALVTCQRLGLRARYLGKVGDDDAGRFQLASLRREGIDLRYLRVARRTANQFACILVDQRTGERTVFWDRDPRLAVAPRQVKRQAITTARLLHVDGCDVEASLRAARWARQARIPVVADLDTVYKRVEELFPYIDYLLASAISFPQSPARPTPSKCWSLWRASTRSRRRA